MYQQTEEDVRIEESLLTAGGSVNKQGSHMIQLLSLLYMYTQKTLYSDSNKHSHSYLLMLYS